MVRELTETDADTLIARYVGPHPWKAGRAEYRLRDAGIQVWSLVAQWKVEGGDTAEVAAGYSISEDEVEAALAYYRRNRAFIDDRIEKNRLFEE